MVEIIREAFGPVAERLGLTQDKALQFAAYETVESLRSHLSKWGIQMLLLLVDDAVVGCGGWSPDGKGKPLGWLARIAVLPAYQGRGYGTLIVERLEDELRKAGFPRAQLAHSDPHEFYERLGYQTVETKQLEDWQIGLTYMQKTL